ncbi:MAG: DUF1573 domain-containing protein [Planctomycetaceae bacterium]|jgi:hypothetical protein|nr:DUF1573 domain-containing protein [Planctomycetaceae bacterium]
MLRTLLSVIFVSVLLGIVIGAGGAFALLAHNRWRPELETNPYHQSQPHTPEQTKQPRAKAFIEETVYHFGVKDVKAGGSHEFFIKNTGTADLTLKLDRTTCSCTGIDITPSRVPPGKTAKCVLTYNADRAMTGPFSQGGVILTNDAENREIRLLVEGVFTASVVVQPSAVNIAKIPAGTDYTMPVRFYGFEDKPLEISEPVWTDREHFALEWQPSAMTAADKEDTLLRTAKSVIEGTLTVKAGLPAGYFQERFHLKTNSPNLPAVELAVNGQVVSSRIAVSGMGFNKSTGIFVLGNTVPGKSIIRELSVQISGHSASSSAVRIKQAEPVWIKAELLPPKNSGQLRVFPIRIEIPADAPVGSYVMRDNGVPAFILLETSEEKTPAETNPASMLIPIQFSVGQ